MIFLFLPLFLSGTCTDLKALYLRWMWQSLGGEREGQCSRTLLEVSFWYSLCLKDVPSVALLSDKQQCHLIHLLLQDEVWLQNLKRQARRFHGNKAIYILWNADCTACLWFVQDNDHTLVPLGLSLKSHKELIIMGYVLCVVQSASALPASFLFARNLFIYRLPFLLEIMVDYTEQVSTVKCWNIQ